MEILAYIFTFIASYAGIETFRRWSLRRNIYDVPNERSSHTVPTARGGGLIIVLVSLGIYAAYNLFNGKTPPLGYLGGAALVALISWLDDLYTVSFVWRFLIHAAAAMLSIATLGYFQEIHIPFYAVVNTGEIGAVLTFLWIVWLTNAYNFMDGIDGIAGTQAVTAGIGWLIIGSLNGCATTGFYGGVLASSSLGFLMLNWQPAKIFMGDVGSAFLGYTFAILPLLAINENARLPDENPNFLLAALLLVWLFVFDTIYTFIRRVFNKEKVWEAHRGHLYQKMNIAGLSHRFISSLYGLFSVTIVSLTTLWWINRGNWGIILTAVVVVQSLGLVIYVQGARTARPLSSAGARDKRL